MIRELLSALTPDFCTILYNGKLDRQAIQDCAAFLQQAIGRKRDRNANMWAILLYFMLMLNMMAQGGREEQEEVFEWMIKSVARSTYELCNHQSILDQLVLAIHKVQSTRTNPLGREQETISWHNYRTLIGPHAAVFNSSIKYYAFRLESLLNVLRNVLGKTFSSVEVSRMIEESDWAMRGKGMFYDCGTNPWPIAKTVLDDSTNASIQVPLAEDELLVSHLKEHRAIFIKQDKFNEIISSVDRGSTFDVSYQDITIKSSHPDVEDYNLFEAATGRDPKGWFGFRALGFTTFGKYCGATNQLMVGGSTTELEVLSTVRQENRDAGFGDIEDLYQPAALLEYYGYHFPNVAALPPGLLKIPFNARNEEGDEPIDYDSPPWRDAYYSDVGMGEAAPCSPIRSTSSDSPPRSRGPETNFNRRVPASRFEDDEQSKAESGPSPNRRVPGSNPLGDATLGLNSSPNGPSQDPSRPLKRRRAGRLVLGEAEDEDGDSEEEVRRRPAHLPLD